VIRAIFRVNDVLSRSIKRVKKKIIPALRIKLVTTPASDENMLAREKLEKS